MKRLIAIILSIVMSVSVCVFAEAEEKSDINSPKKATISTLNGNFGNLLKTSLFIVYLLNLYNNYQPSEAASVGIIGGADGPTAIYIQEGE